MDLSKSKKPSSNGTTKVGVLDLSKDGEKPYLPPKVETDETGTFKKPLPFKEGIRLWRSGGGNFKTSPEKKEIASLERKRKPEELSQIYSKRRSLDGSFGIKSSPQYRSSSASQRSQSPNLNKNTLIQMRSKLYGSEPKLSRSYSKPYDSGNNAGIKKLRSSDLSGDKIHKSHLDKSITNNKSDKSPDTKMSSDKDKLVYDRQNLHKDKNEKMKLNSSHGAAALEKHAKGNKILDTSPKPKQQQHFFQKELLIKLNKIDDKILKDKGLDKLFQEAKAKALQRNEAKTSKDNISNKNEYKTAAEDKSLKSRENVGKDDQVDKFKLDRAKEKSLDEIKTKSPAPIKAPPQPYFLNSKINLSERSLKVLSAKKNLLDKSKGKTMKTTDDSLSKKPEDSKTKSINDVKTKDKNVILANMKLDKNQKNENSLDKHQKDKLVNISNEKSKKIEAEDKADKSKDSQKNGKIFKNLDQKQATIEDKVEGKFIAPDNETFSKGCQEIPFENRPLEFKSVESSAVSDSSNENSSEPTEDPLSGEVSSHLKAAYLTREIRKSIEAKLASKRHLSTDSLDLPLGKQLKAVDSQNSERNSIIEIILSSDEEAKGSPPSEVEKETPNEQGSSKSSTNLDKIISENTINTIQDVNTKMSTNQSQLSGKNDLTTPATTTDSNIHKTEDSLVKGRTKLESNDKSSAIANINSNARLDLPSPAIKMNTEIIPNSSPTTITNNFSPAVDTLTDIISDPFNKQETSKISDTKFGHSPLNTINTIPDFSSDPNTSTNMNMNNLYCKTPYTLTTNEDPNLNSILSPPFADLNTNPSNFTNNSNDLSSDWSDTTHNIIIQSANIINDITTNDNGYTDFLTNPNNLTLLESTNMSTTTNYTELPSNTNDFFANPFNTENTTLTDLSSFTSFDNSIYNTGINISNINTNNTSNNFTMPSASTPNYYANSRNCYDDYDISYLPSTSKGIHHPSNDLSSTITLPIAIPSMRPSTSKAATAKAKTTTNNNSRSKLDGINQFIKESRQKVSYIKAEINSTLKEMKKDEKKPMPAATSLRMRKTIVTSPEKPTGDISSEDESPSEEPMVVELNEEEKALDDKFKASCEPFLQHLPCFKLKVNKKVFPICRECRRRKASDPQSNDIYCRFFEFRRLKYNSAGVLFIEGFPNPFADATRDDIIPWQPDEETEPTAGYMDVQVCRYILLHVGDQFCYLWRQEAEALELHENPDDTIAWKKAVQGIREICDVCDTTLFNYHWTCAECGFGVCIDCFKDRKNNITCRKTKDRAQKGCDKFHWLLCNSTASSKAVEHKLNKLVLTQIIPGDALSELGNTMHFVRNVWKVPQLCHCLLSRENYRSTEIDDLVKEMITQSRIYENTCASSMATKEMFRQTTRRSKLHEKKLAFTKACNIEYIPGQIWDIDTLLEDPIEHAYDNIQHINFLRPGLAGLRRFLPPKVMMFNTAGMQAVGVPHEVLCNGKLLLLTNPVNPGNRLLFQDAWKNGQPVMISNVSRSLDLSVWRPEAFCRDFGDKPNDLINCLNGNLVPNQPMRHFWEGFQSMNKRLLDNKGQPMLLKLKDWPPGDDFAEILPTRYADLMNGLPMPEYTLRTGNLNLASCLPKMFVPPDLGPKMYNAYGSALYPSKGTTNLHLDISDAVNIMVYVGIPEDLDNNAQINAANKAITIGGCDYLTRQRLFSSEEKPIPGALWHIFSAQDADKIRDLLNRVTLERGFRLEPDHDPIHDQNWYLDDKLRARLYKEYQVESYPIVQCLGDAVFIPAGAPHQVQNLHNCIKVAEDFVSPENITHCVHLTQEFRRLSSSHTNHEDKLQIKNIIYHAVKDCCTILSRALVKKANEKLLKAQKAIESRKNTFVFKKPYPVPLRKETVA